MARLNSKEDKKLSTKHHFRQPRQDFLQCSVSQCNTDADKDSLCKVSEYEISKHSKYNLPDIRSVDGNGRAVYWLYRHNLADGHTVRQKSEIFSQARKNTPPYGSGNTSSIFTSVQMAREKADTTLQRVRLRRGLCKLREMFLKSGPSDIEIKETYNSYLNLDDVHALHLYLKSNKPLTNDQYQNLALNLELKQCLLQKIQKVNQEGKTNKDYLLPSQVSVDDIQENQRVQLEKYMKRYSASPAVSKQVTGHFQKKVNAKEESKHVKPEGRNADILARSGLSLKDLEHVLNQINFIVKGEHFDQITEMQKNQIQSYLKSISFESRMTELKKENNQCVLNQLINEGLQHVLRNLIKPTSTNSNASSLEAKSDSGNLVPTIDSNTLRESHAKPDIFAKSSSEVKPDDGKPAANLEKPKRDEDVTCLECDKYSAGTSSDENINPDVRSKNWEQYDFGEKPNIVTECELTTKLISKELSRMKPAEEKQRDLQSHGDSLFKNEDNAMTQNRMGFYVDDNLKHRKDVEDTDDSKVTAQKAGRQIEDGKSKYYHRQRISRNYSQTNTARSQLGEDEAVSNVNNQKLKVLSCEKIDCFRSQQVFSAEVDEKLQQCHAVAERTGKKQRGLAGVQEGKRVQKNVYLDEGPYCTSYTQDSGSQCYSVQNHQSTDDKCEGHMAEEAYYEKLHKTTSTRGEFCHRESNTEESLDSVHLRRREYVDSSLQCRIGMEKNREPLSNNRKNQLTQYEPDLFEKRIGKNNRQSTEDKKYNENKQSMLKQKTKQTHKNSEIDKYSIKSRKQTSDLNILPQAIEVQQHRPIGEYAKCLTKIKVKREVRATPKSGEMFGEQIAKQLQRLKQNQKPLCFAEVELSADSLNQPHIVGDMQKSINDLMNDKNESNRARKTSQKHMSTKSSDKHSPRNIDRYLMMSYQNDIRNKFESSYDYLLPSAKRNNVEVEEDLHQELICSDYDIYIKRVKEKSLVSRVATKQQHDEFEWRSESNRQVNDNHSTPLTEESGITQSIELNLYSKSIDDLAGASSSTEAIADSRSSNSLEKFLIDENTCGLTESVESESHSSSDEDTPSLTAIPIYKEGVEIAKIKQGGKSCSRKTNRSTQMFEHVTKNDLYTLQWIHDNLFEININPHTLIVDKKLKGVSEKSWIS